MEVRSASVLLRVCDTCGYGDKAESLKSAIEQLGALCEIQEACGIGGCGSMEARDQVD